MPLNEKKIKNIMQKENINFDLYEIDDRPNQKTDRDGGFGSTGVS